MRYIEQNFSGLKITNNQKITNMNYLSNLDGPSFIILIIIVVILAIAIPYFLVRWIFSIDKQLENQQTQIDLLKEIVLLLKTKS